MYKVLLVEDDFSLAEAIKKQMEKYDYEVKTIEDFQNVTEEFIKFSPQVVLMDIMLPFKDGYYWCNEIRKISSTPIIFISSANDGMNIVMALNMGGDDFISKPFDGMVLVAKVQAMIRRTYELNDNLSILEINGAILNISNGVLTYNDKKIELTKNEFRILQTLLENKGKIVSRETLMLKLWESDLYIEENTLTVNVSRLRKKLEDIGLIEVISTKSKAGYIIDEKK